MKPTHILWICLAPFLFAGWWMFIIFVISMASGWRRMAEKYAAIRQPEGVLFKHQSARIRGANYNRVLVIVVASEGLFMRPTWPFQFGHRPLLIPWREIQNRKPRRFLWREMVRFDVGSPTVVWMELPKKILDAYDEKFNQSRSSGARV